MAESYAKLQLAKMLQGNTIFFRVNDVGDECLFPRPSGGSFGMGVMYFTVPEYVDQTDSKRGLTEEEYFKLPRSARSRYRKALAIHITKALWERIRNDVHFQSQIVVDVYNQMNPRTPIEPSKLWSNRAIACGAADFDLFFVDYAAERGNVAYLKHLSRTGGSQDDPHGALANEALKALMRLGHA